MDRDRLKESYEKEMAILEQKRKSEIE